MRFLVTGAAGFIGSNFVNHCLKTGREVCGVIDNLTYASDWRRIPTSVPLYRQSIEAATLKYIFEQTNPDVIINFSAETHVDNSIVGCNNFIASNYCGVHNILNHIREYQEKTRKQILLVHISTDEVYGDIPIDSRRKFKEDDPLKPNNPYAATKAAADLLIQAYHHTYKDFNYIICRAANNYGPNQHFEKLLPTIIRKALKDEPIPIYGDGSNVREWLWVDDFVKGILKVTDLFLQPHSATGKLFNFGSGVERSNLETVRTVLKLMDKPESLISFVEDRPGHDRKYAINWEKVNEITNWAPQANFEEGLKIVIADITERIAARDGLNRQ